MHHYYYTDFDITIRGTHIPYTVTAEYQGRTAEGFFEHDITQPIWQRIVQQLGALGQIGHTAITEAGSELFKGVINNAVRDLWVNARADLESTQIDGLRIRLALQPPAVASLPWESLYDPDRNEAFAADGVTTLVRVENLHQYVGPSRPLEAKLPLKILIAIPEDPTGKLNGAEEIQKIEDALASKIPDQIQLATPLQGRFDINELRKTIEAEQADVLHLVSHGKPDAILLWKRGEPDFTPSSSLKVTLRRTTSVKLVFLNACLAGQASEQNPFSNVAPQLLQAGIPAVIAMQFEIRDDAAIEFAQFVYEELVSGPYPGSVDAAVGYARSSLYALDPDRFDYGTPILWLNARDGLIADFPEKPIPSAESKAKLTERLSEAMYTSSQGQGEGSSSESSNEIERWADSLNEIDETLLPPPLRMLGADWRGSVRELQGLLHQLESLQNTEAEDAVAQRTEKLKQVREKQAKIAKLLPMIRRYSQGETH